MSLSELAQQLLCTKQQVCKVWSVVITCAALMLIRLTTCHRICQRLTGVLWAGQAELHVLRRVMQKNIRITRHGFVRVVATA